MNNKGMGLVGVMVAMGIMSILAVALMDINLMMVKTNATAQANSDIIQYVQQLRNTLQYAQQSTNVLTGVNITDPLLALKDPLSSTTVIAGKNYKTQVNAAWKVNHLAFENVLVVPSQANLFRVTLVAFIELDQRRIQGGLIKKKVIGDVFCVINSGIISTCYGSQDVISTAQNTCSTMGGNWNTATAKCTLTPIVQTVQLASVTPTVITPVIAAPVTSYNPKSEHDDDRNKGDHNNDGHEDNGKGSGKDDSPCDGRK